MSLIDSVAGLMESAKKLRAIADNLGDVDLKSQIVDEIMQLQEIREQFVATEAANVGSVGSAVASQQDGEPKEQLLSFDDKDKMVHFEPSTDGETYGLHADAGESDAGKDGPAAAVDPSESAATASSDTGTDISADTIKISASPDGSKFAGLSEGDRFSLAEKNIQKLEPRHLATLKKMNAILTYEQKKKKLAATKAGTQAGKKGRELQQAVMAAIGLDDEQKAQMAAARAELQRIRTAIAKQVEGLLTPEQTARLLKGLSKEKKKDD